MIPVLHLRLMAHVDQREEALRAEENRQAREVARRDLAALREGMQPWRAPEPLELAPVDGCYEHELAVERVGAGLAALVGSAPRDPVGHLNWLATAAAHDDAKARALAGTYGRLLTAQVSAEDHARLVAVAAYRKTLEAHPETLPAALRAQVEDALDEERLDAERGEILPTGKRGGRNGAFAERERESLRAAGFTAAEVAELIPSSRLSNGSAAAARDRQKKARRR